MPHHASRPFPGFAAALVAVLLPAGATASSRTVADHELARASAAAVHGRVTAVQSAWDPASDAIYTYVAVDVVESWGLAGSPARIVVKQLGGMVGHTALVVGGQARFDAGEEVVLFLDVRPRDRTLSVAGLEQGKWTLTASADPVAVMTREVHGTDPATVVSRDYRSLADLHALAALVGGRASASSAVLAPSAPGAAPGRDVAGFAYLNPSIPARWHQADSGSAVDVDTQSGGHPQFAGGGLTQLARAAGLWAAAGPLRLQPGVSRSARCFANSEPSDGRISVTYGDPCGEIADGSSTLAIGGAYFSSSDVRIVNGVSFWKMIKGMIVTDNPPSKFSWMSTGCYEDVLAHELGHAIGFGHAAARPALMYPAISPDCGSRTTAAPLQADDLAGMAAIYPSGAALAPPGAPASLNSVVIGATVTITWSAPSGGGAPVAYQLQAGSAPGLMDIATVTVAGTSIVVPGVPNGVYHVRVLAGNAAGVGPPTPDHAIQVGPAPPGQPRNFTASSGAPGQVALAWLPPSTGGAVSSYVLLAGYSPSASTFQIPVSGTGLAASGIGAATYYVRVVAVNAAGVSAPSGEVALVVQ